MPSQKKKLSEAFSFIGYYKLQLINNIIELFWNFQSFWTFREFSLSLQLLSISLDIIISNFSPLIFVTSWRHFSVIAYTTTDTQFGPHHQKDWNIMLFLLKIKVNLNFINLNYAPMNFLYVRVCVNIIFLVF